MNRCKNNMRDKKKFKKIYKKSLKTKIRRGFKIKIKIDDGKENENDDWNRINKLKKYA